MQQTFKTNSFMHKKLFLLVQLTFLQLMLSVLPGILLYQTQKGENWKGSFILFLYLFLSHFSEVLTRLQYRKKQYLPSLLYGVKSIISLILIFIFAHLSTWQFSFLLFAYELFQLLTRMKAFEYFDRFYYTLLHPFFKGIVFNLLFLMKPPAFFERQYLLFLLPAFFTLVTLTLYQQGQITQKNNTTLFLIAFLISILFAVGCSIYLAFSLKLFNFLHVLGYLISFITGVYLITKQHDFLKSELTLSFFLLMGLFLLYI